MKASLIFLAVAVALISVAAGIGLQRQAGRIDGLVQTVQAQQRQLGRAAASLSAAQSRLAGSHRDLLTCTDLHELEQQLSVQGVDGTGQTVYSSVQSMWLPAHCING
jgi:hypothetical protein